MTAAGLLAAAGAGAAPAPLDFDRTFSAAGEPALHYRVLFASGGGVHRMEVWRDRDRRVRRDTDGMLTSVAVRRPTGYTLALFDRRRRTVTRIGRENLYRIGLFADWFDQGHGLRHPKTAYRLTQASAPPGAPAPLGPCRWYALEQGGRATLLCWDARNRLPLVMMGGGRPVWRVTALDRAPIAPSVFTVDARGYVLVDADRDVEGD